jgi:BirA family transcriptional regulator, biotin operon repressor / biotin---[acetyl-CoA-carboxylase] ligase
LADPTFDRAAFAGRLTTRRLGRTLIARAAVESTNDVAWEALAAGTPDGTVVVSDAQTRGRGREGRAWHTAPGRALAMSVVLHLGCDLRQAGTLPLVAGLALVEGLDALGVAARLKWPNDVLIGTRKLAGILVECRRAPHAAGGAGGDVAVVGVGVNVALRDGDLPGDVAGLATSLAGEGHALTREQVAAAFLSRLEPLWDAHAEGGRERVLERWRARADFWGHPVTVRTPAGALDGVARALDPDGALVLTLADGRETRVLAGDLEVAWPAERAR